MVQGNSDNGMILEVSQQYNLHNCIIFNAIKQQSLSKLALGDTQLRKWQIFDLNVRSRSYIMLRKFSQLIQKGAMILCSNY